MAMNYHTISGWKRLSDKHKAEAVELFKHLPTEFSCECVRCYECGDSRTVARPYYKKNEEGVNPFLEKKYMNYCKNCGKPKISGSGEMYGLEHTRFCPKFNTIGPTAPTLLPVDEKGWMKLMEWKKGMKGIKTVEMIDKALLTRGKVA